MERLLGTPIAYPGMSLSEAYHRPSTTSRVLSVLEWILGIFGGIDAVVVGVAVGHSSALAGFVDALTTLFGTVVVVIVLVALEDLLSLGQWQLFVAARMASGINTTAPGAVKPLPQPDTTKQPAAPVQRWLACTNCHALTLVHGAESTLNCWNCGDALPLGVPASGDAPGA